MFISMLLSKNNDCYSTFLKIISIVGAMGGWMGFYAFRFHFNNEDAADGALISGIYAAIRRTEHYFNQRDSMLHLIIL